MTFLVVACNSNTSVDHAAIARTQAQEMADAMLAKDFMHMSDYIHPNLISYFGGKEDFIKIFFDEASRDTLTYLSVTTSLPDEVIKTDQNYQCILYQKTIANDGFRDLSSETALLGISDFAGEKWTFVQISGSFSELKELIPEVSEKLFKD